MQKYAIGSKMLCTYDCYRLVNEPVVIVGYQPESSCNDELYEIKALRDAGDLKAGETCKCFEYRLTEIKLKQLTVAEIEKALGYGVEIIRG